MQCTATHSSSSVFQRGEPLLQRRGRPMLGARQAPVRAAAETEGPMIVTQKKELKLLTPKYCESIHQTRRRPTRTVDIGPVKVGSEHRIALQTMTTTDTRDVEATVEQVKRCADAGADIVRITVQSKREAEACMRIRERLFKDKYDTPLVADIHFQPAVALMVADAFEKIRINPGNFADGRKTFDEINYDDPSEFAAEREYIREVFTPLVEKCKSLNRAMRIGTNHGSLSARILSFYGDTPRGMVESAFEFADICRDNDYHNFLFSMKASNPLVMVQAYRLLAEEQYNRNWDYPLHLGVTEAGEGEDGRMKSAIGIGSLLMDGLGDTIRVSLTEDPEYEINPCGRLANLGKKADEEKWGVEAFEEHRDTHLFSRRQGGRGRVAGWRSSWFLSWPAGRVHDWVGTLPEQREGDTVDYRPLLHRDGSVLAVVYPSDLEQPELMYRRLGAKLVVGMPFKDIATADSILMYQVPASDDVAGRRALRRLQEVGVHVMAPAEVLAANPLPDAVAVMQLAVAASAHRAGGVQLPEGAGRLAVFIDGSESAEDLAALKACWLMLGGCRSGAELTCAACMYTNDLGAVMGLLKTAPGLSRVHASRRVFEQLQQQEISLPIIHHITFPDGSSRDDIVLQAGERLVGWWAGGLAGSMVGALMVDGYGDGLVVECATEDGDYLRTTAFGLLQEVTDQIRTRTGHLPGVSIAVMGCIVNGPGEMADADFGYVGGAPGKIDLYVGKEVVRRNIPNEDACDQLIDLIKEHGRWQEMEVEEEEGEQALAGAATARQKTCDIGMARSAPNVLVTGTPGTGKTSLSEQVAAATGLKHLNIGDLVKSQQLHTGWDDEFECLVIDEDKVCDALEDLMAEGGCLVDYHGCDFFPERWFDLVVVLQADNTVLWERLEKRGYSERKVQENVQCEIMHVIVEEARDSYGEGVVHVLQSSTAEEMEENVERLTQWARSWRPSS
ncbi:4-hydroxy-3-methylbut-2-en-1-yl diphosphate synthase (ferredoxin) [Chlorella vulgaris]